MRSTTSPGTEPTGAGMVGTDPIAELGRAVVEAAGIAAGQRVLDVAAGSGSAALLAARIGAEVVASELSPQRLAAGRRAATDCGLDVEWVEADTEALPFADDDFDAVVSVLGAMFAPHHQQAADELVRVCRPGGVIAMVTLAPEALTGRPSPPAALWGSEDHVRALFGQRVTDLRFCHSSAGPGAQSHPADISRYLIVTATRRRRDQPCPE